MEASTTAASGAGTPAGPTAPPAASRGQTSDPAAAFWSLAAEAAFSGVGSSPHGLTATEAATRLARYGPNRIDSERRAGSLALLARQFASPIVLILVFATVLSGLLGDVTDAG